MKDERRLVWGQAIDALLEGEGVAPAALSRLPWDRAGAQEALLERIPGASPAAFAELHRLFHQWGLYQEHVRGLTGGTRWQRSRSAIVLARMRCEETLPGIAGLLHWPHPDVRTAAMTALGLLGRAEAVPPLIGMLSVSTDREARAALSALLRCAQGSPALLAPHLQHPAPVVRLVVAGALGELARREEIPALLGAVADREPEVRARVARALGHTGAPAACEGLAKLAADSVWYVRLQAAAALGHVACEASEGLLWRAVGDSHALVQQKAALALYALRGEATSVLEHLGERSAHRAALAGLVDELARRGATWEAVTGVASASPEKREPSRALVRMLLRNGFYAATLYAVEAHPQLSLRHELLELVRESARPSVHPHLEALLGSPTLDPESRQRVEALLASRGGRG